MDSRTPDVIVVGAGNAALCAALSANEAGASVLVLEKSPRAERGGNTQVTGGGRYAYDDINGLRDLFPDLITDEVMQRLEVEPYTVEHYYGDLMRASQGRADPELTMILARESAAWVQWLQGLGVKYQVRWEMQGIFDKGDGKVYVSMQMGGTPVGPVGKMRAVLNHLFGIIESRGDMEIRYETKAVRLLVDGIGRVRGVQVKDGTGFHDLEARGVILGCGGFEANPEMRTRYLGPGWDLAKVRGSRYNTGEGLQMALDIGAAMAGNVSGCHATNVFLSGPDVEMGDDAHAHFYPYGIEVNVHGKRFADEGSDFETYTYARMGRAVLAQDGSIAYQLFDSKVTYLFERPYYQPDDPDQAGRGVSADSVEGVADKLHAKGLKIDKEALLTTVREFNASVQGGSFDPITLDGKSTASLDPPKSNWALPIDTPPFYCYPVTCGITFTYGGLRIDRHARVLDTEGKVIPGLYATGEVAGTFYDNYMGGAGIAKGGVFGRIAGKAAAAEIRGQTLS